MKRTVVIARHEENISWAESIGPDLVVIQKDEHVPNEGREPLSYIWYIKENYDTLEGTYFFLQGNPIDHCPNVHKELQNMDGDFRWFGNRGPYACDMQGAPQDNVNISSFINEIKLSYNPLTIEFWGCCLFMVSAENIQKRSKEFYENLYEVLLKGERREYAFERCVGLIFGGNHD